METKGMDKPNDTDILRAEDIIPPFNQKKEPPRKQSSNTETPAQKKSEIPKFDLAKQIMAEKRKNASTKRKAPEKKSTQVSRNQKTSTEYNGVRNVIESAQSILHKPKKEKLSPIPITTPIPIPTPKTIPTPITNAYDRIISEIVARDIKKLISKI